MKAALLHSRRGRLLLIAIAFGLVVGVLVWRAPDLHYVGNAFTAVAWEWVAAALAANLVSVAVRAAAWHVVLNQALPDADLRHRHVFSAFCVGLLGNAVIPGRVGEIARIAVLSRRLPNRRDTWASAFGSVFAHRLFDVLPTIGLVLYVIASTTIPSWALPGVESIVGIGAVLLAGGCFLAWRHRRRQFHPPARAGRIRRLLYQTLGGLRVFHSPGPAFLAAMLQILGWTTQLLAVFLAFKAFQIDAPVAAAGVVLLAINVAIAFPLWPGSVGLFQVATALALSPWVASQNGFAFGIGLQAIEMSVGIGLGLLFLAREGISFAMLKRIPKVTEGIEEEKESKPDELEQRLDVRVERHVRRERPRAGAQTSERAG